jgi:hypothetical protein
MDRRIESFLGDVLALAGEESDAVREGVRVALAKCEAIFRLQEPKKRLTATFGPSKRPTFASSSATAVSGLEWRKGFTTFDCLGIRY